MILQPRIAASDSFSHCPSNRAPRPCIETGSQDPPCTSTASRRCSQAKSNRQRRLQNLTSRCGQGSSAATICCQSASSSWLLIEKGSLVPRQGDPRALAVGGIGLP